MRLPWLLAGSTAPGLYQGQIPEDNNDDMY